MRAEYLDLQDVGGLTVQTSSINIMKEFQDYKKNLSADLKEEVKKGLFESIQAFNISQQENIPQQFPFEWSQHPDTPDFTPSQNTMFAAQQNANNPMIAQLMEQMEIMQTQLAAVCSLVPNESIPNDATKKDNTINPKTGKPWKKYCWSCGCCTHWSKTCPNKKRGHKDEATFRNRIGGSSENCL